MSGVSPLADRLPSAGGAHTVAFDRTLTAAALDKAMVPLAPSLPTELRFDMQKVKFADPTALLYLAACITTLDRNGHEISIELPASKRVRDLMRRYRFGNALQRLLARPATSLLADTSESYLVEPQLHYQSSLHDARTPTIHTRASERLAALQVLERPKMDEAVAASNRWREPEVKALLETHLGGRANLVAPGIVHEALANAVSHPQAKHVVTTGFLDDRARGGRGLLTIAFWDDGDSIVETLRRALAHGNRLRTAAFDIYYDWYAIYSAGAHGTPKRYQARIYSGVDPSGDASDAELLVASTFPGITSDPTRDPQGAELRRYGRDYDRPGMGLYILTSLAVDSFNGEVLIRTSSATANFSRAARGVQERHQCRYRVAVVETPAMGEYFSGNHVVVRLPLQF